MQRDRKKRRLIYLNKNFECLMCACFVFMAQNCCSSAEVLLRSCSLLVVIDYITPIRK